MPAPFQGNAFQNSAFDADRSAWIRATKQIELWTVVTEQSEVWHSADTGIVTINNMFDGDIFQSNIFQGGGATVEIDVETWTVLAAPDDDVGSDPAFQGSAFQTNAWQASLPISPWVEKTKQTELWIAA